MEYSSSGSTIQVGRRHRHILFLVFASALSIFTGTRRILASKLLLVELGLGSVGINGYDDGKADSLHDNNTATATYHDWWLYCTMSPDRNLTHPHLGARHPTNGSLGMVVNPSIQRLRQPSITPTMVLTLNQTINSTTNTSTDFVSFLCPAENRSYGIEGAEPNEVLHKIRQGLQHTRKMLDITTTDRKSDGADNTANNASLGLPVRILCMVYTVHAPTRDNHSLQAAIAETWGRECDGFFGASNVTNHSIGTIDLVHQGPEEYSNIWQKIRTMWTYAFDHYLEDYDYFYIAGDDTYVLMDHMRFFLQSRRVQLLQQGYIDRITGYYIKKGYNTTSHLRPRPLIFGTPMMVNTIPVFSGGGGYVLNQAALRLWGEKGINTHHPNDVDSKEDILMANFFFDHHVYLSDTQDENGCWRFDFNAYYAINYNGKNTWINPSSLRKRFGFRNPSRLASASKYHITFHMKYGKYRLVPMKRTVTDLLWRYHAFFNNWCPNDNNQGDQA